MPAMAVAALAAAGCGATGGAAPGAPAASEAIVYPRADRGDVVDVHHGTAVPDPWRALEDPDAPATRAWIEAQNEVTERFLAAVPERDALRSRLTRLWDYEKHGIPRLEGGRTFHTRNDGLQQQAVLWVTDAPGAEPRVLLDPNTLSADGTIALAGHVPSPDGRYLAYGLASGGSDWNTWHVRDVATGRDLPDRLEWVKFSAPAWLPDGSGFFYGRYAAPAPGVERAAQNFHQKLWFHRIGDPQDADRLVYERPDRKEWGFGAQVTDDGRWLTLSVWRGTERRNAFFHRDLSQPDAPVVELLSAWDAAYDFVGNEGSVFYFRTDLDAPNGRVIAIDANRPARSDWREVVPESSDVVQSVSRVGGRLFVESLRHAASRVRTFDLSGRELGDVPLPGLGSVAGFGGRADDTVTWFAFTSFTTPTTIHRFDVATGEVSLHRRPQVDFRPEDYEMVQTFATSRDGTRVPVFVTSKRGVARDGRRRTVLTGYGGFNAAMTPGFSAAALVWMERGGAYAVACLRGGGEYGREWHLAGTKERKQNVFDDFFAAAEHLVAEGWTTPSRLAIQGGSNGGLLVGACMTQRPELFGACLPAVGVLDMLRYHKFTIGWAWASDYGTAEDPAEFRTLLAYSPLHNVRPGVCYPPTLITTGDHDDRVVPGHSFKFAAELQSAQACANPVLLRVETRAGHGAGKPTSKVIEEWADRWAFLVRVLED